jgi:hypothetical protein
MIFHSNLELLNCKAPTHTVLCLDGIAGGHYRYVHSNPDR